MYVYVFATTYIYLLYYMYMYAYIINHNDGVIHYVWRLRNLTQ